MPMSPGFCLMMQVSLTAAEVFADWTSLHTLNSGNMWTHFQIIPPRTDLPEAGTTTGKWRAHPYRDINSNITREMNAIVDSRFTKTKYQHESIVIMEKDPAVIESATNLYERNPNASTLLLLKNGALYVLRGNLFLPTYHNVILVGHGSKGANAKLWSTGYGPKNLARFVSVLTSLSIFGHVGTVSIISCNLGTDQQFMLQLLKVLRSVSVETKLVLYSSLLSVSPDGVIMTREDGVWWSHDLSRKVIAELDHGGKLLIKMVQGCKGPMIPDYRGKMLYLQTIEWPRDPKMFVPWELRKKYPFIDCLEGLTWSLFFGENAQRRAPAYTSEHDQEHKKTVWLIEPGPKQDENTIFRKILTIQDLLVEIRFNGREEVPSDLYYVLNECIYMVNGKNLSVKLVGKFIGNESHTDTELFRQNFIDQMNKSSLQDLRQGLKESKFIDFCRETFQYQQCNSNCERWGHYFMAAVFSASVRNFRTFSLFLMSVIGCEVGRSQGIDSPLCTAFAGDDHPMVTEQPWPVDLHRGFYGCTVDNYEMAPQNRQTWLDQIVAKENALYIKSTTMMNEVGHYEQTELSIFGKVKVMNKYVFSSYQEFFRGTPEGKKLKRGCIVMVSAT